MKASQFLISTLKQTPNDADIASSQLMVRAGLIKKLASGLYVWMPMGLRVLKKVERVVREEMDKAGAQELLMPMVQPAELWQKSGRWDDNDAELLRLKDRHARDFVLGPTHEEVITDIAQSQLKSYKQLPINFYQIQSKFRDEIRPRFGVMRAREFMMKDAYSFHLDIDCLGQTYAKMYQSYCNIFSRLGLNFRAVRADTGNMGGFLSHEFQVLADTGEDDIVFSDKSDYAANIELATAYTPTKTQIPTEQPTTVDTPNMQSCEEVARFLNIDTSSIVKVLIVKGANANNNNADEKSKWIALALCGHHTLNEIKATKHPKIANDIQLANDEDLQKLGLVKGFIGIDIDLPLIVDDSAAVMVDFVTGANQKDKHIMGANWSEEIETFDLRNVVEGDKSPDGQGFLRIRRGIEVGHIFQLGDKYAKALDCKVLDNHGKAVTTMMGCYGIGVSRIVAAAIEQNHDEKGIVWPTTQNACDNIAPFYVAVVPMRSKDGVAEQKAEQLYQVLKNAGVDVLLDDRDERAGVKFADLELLGIPHRIVVSAKNLDNNHYEYQARTKDAVLLEYDALLKTLGVDGA